MTVKELKDKIKDMPDELEVRLVCWHEGTDGDSGYDTEEEFSCVYIVPATYGRYPKPNRVLLD